jgi:hypothetical protein
MLGDAARMTKPNHKTFDQAVKMLSGLPGIPDDPRGAPPEVRALGAFSEPTAEEMEKGMEAVKYSKIINVAGVFVKTFDLSDEKQAAEYTKLYTRLYQKHAEKSILITDKDKRFVSDVNGARWLIHLEWLEYDLIVKDHQKPRTEDNATRQQHPPVEYRPTNG